jgi:hypothetical protein
MSIKTSFSNLCAVLKEMLNGKVDKVSGKGLSTNDFTAAYKTKLDGIAAGANKITVDSALSGTSTNPVQNRVVAERIGTIEANIKQNTSSISTINANVAKKQDTLTAGANITISGTMISAKDTTYSVATTSTNGLMSKDDKKKLDRMAAIVVDDSISTTSTNVIQNKAVGLKFQGVDSEISGINSVLNSTADEIATIVNGYGSKNLVNYSLIPNSTGGGITRKNNGDGSITYSGTSTLTYTTYLPLMAGQSLGAGTYIFTPNPTTTASYTYQIYKNGSYWKNITANQAIEITEAGEYSIGLALNSKATISNTFKPMLRYAAIKDDTYVPYAMTNRELTEKVIDTGWKTTGNLKYRKSGYIVALQGVVTPSSSAMSITLGTLSEDCRPSQDINIAQAGTDTPSRQIIVQTDGNVVLLFASNCTASHTYAYNGIFMI